MNPLKIAVLFGGQSPEHDVSVDSGIKVVAALESRPPAQGARITPVFISREGRWFWPAGGTHPPVPSPSAATARAVKDPAAFASAFAPESLGFAAALRRLEADAYDSVFIILHGVNGEDGRLQGALELAHIPFTGSGSAASSLAMDKPRSQSYLRSLGVPVPEFMTLDRREMPEAEIAARILDRLDLPCVVKPALGGSSVGVTIVRDASELTPALEAIFEQGPLVLAERFIRGREFTCGVLDREGKGQIALPVTEIIPPEGRFFDYTAKYTPGVTREVTPAEIPADLREEIRHLAARVHRAVGCEGFSRVDFMVGPEGTRVLEVNTIPGMTATSLLPQGAAAAGIDFPDLLWGIVDHSLRRAAGDAAAVGV